MRSAIILFPVLIILSVACSEKSIPEKVKYGEITEKECMQNLQHRYHLVRPAEVTPNSKLPLILILDAHGNGKMAVEKFLPAVVQIPCIVAGSDLIRNNYPNYDRAISEVISDLKSRYSVDDEQLIIAGFSGGARMAYNYSLYHQVKGVLMCGAGPGQQMPVCPVYSISGMGDFNFSEQYYHPDLSSLTATGFTADYFHGLHEWPAPDQLEDALLFLLKDTEAGSEAGPDRIAKLLYTADSLLNSGDMVLSWKALEKASKLSQKKQQQEKIERKAGSILNSEDFQGIIKGLEDNLAKERKMQQAYAQRLLSGDFTWWKNEINLLHDRIAMGSPGLENDHYLRIKGYIGIMLYSLSGRMISSDINNPQLQVILDVYAFAEPENPDPYYFKALYLYHTGKEKNCIENLEKASKLGFSDRGRLQNDFPSELLQKLESWLSL